MSWLHIGDDRLVEAHTPYLPYAQPFYTYHAWLPPSKPDTFSRPRSATTHHITPPYSSTFQPHRPTTTTPFETRAAAPPRVQHKHHVHLVDHEHPTYHTHEVIHRHHYPHYVSTDTQHTHTRNGRPATFHPPPLSHGEVAGTFVIDPVRSYELDAIRGCYDSPYESKRSSSCYRAHRGGFTPGTYSRGTKLPAYSPYGYSTRRGLSRMHRPYH